MAFPASDSLACVGAWDATPSWATPLHSAARGACCVNSAIHALVPTLSGYRQRKRRMVSQAPPTGQGAPGEIGPGSVPFPELSPGPADARETARMVIQMYGSAIVDLHLSRPRFVPAPGPRPAVSGLVRVQIERQSLLTNQLHVDVKVDGDAAKAVVRRLDGTRDRATLIRELAEAGTPLTEESLEKCLRQLARMALLTA